MKCRAAAVAVLLSTILAGSNADARGPYGSISVGNWKGGAYTNDETGSFTHCAAGARYASGVFFLVMIDNNGGWSLGFMHEQWRLTTGEAFPLTLTFDGRQPFNVHGVPIAATTWPGPAGGASRVATSSLRLSTSGDFSETHSPWPECRAACVFIIYAPLCIWLADVPAGDLMAAVFPIRPTLRIRRRRVRCFRSTLCARFFRFAHGDQRCLRGPPAVGSRRSVERIGLRCQAIRQPR
jgi:hypothetical protein